MSHHPALKDKWALVTGASSGLGADFARQLAARGARLILVARREEKLRELAAELEEKFGVETAVMPADLGDREAVAALATRVKDAGHEVRVLVNNAGFGVYGDFLEIPWEREQQMLELDILTLVHLTKLFVKDMVAAGDGYILQVASIGAYQPTPTYACYAAAKTFVLHFGEALHRELKGTGVSCTTISPGVTKTAFLEVSGQEATLYQRLVMMDSPTVCAIGIDRMLRRRSSVVPGWINALSAFSVRFVPRDMQAWMAEKLMR